ncbi:DUF2232 domain-containing protein [Anaerorhabdus sp.]|uniref:DUF2232 domain-containing protein n=1 Tax=Anaerorhabdus sp. TaxID=1872524 RepID=UPI002FCB1596
MNNNVRKITDGAMMVALVGVLILINRQFAGILELFAWILPLPMVFFTAKYGWKDGILPLSAMVLLTLILGTPQSIYYFAVTAISGLIYGNGVKVGWNNRKLLFVTMTISVISSLVTTVLFASFFGYDINMEIKTIGDMMNQVIGSTGVAFAFDVTQLIKVSVGFSVIFAGVLEGLLIHVISRLMLTRFGFHIPKAKPLSQINAPKWTGYVALVGWAVAEYGLRTPLEQNIQVLAMIVLIISNIYLIGFGYLGAVILGAAKFKKNISLYLMIGLILFMQIAIPALAFFGFLYITTDWRENLLRRVQNGQTK